MMHLEIERRFLVHDTTFLKRVESVHIRQGYLVISPDITIRVRITGPQAWLTMKGPGRPDTGRMEFEYPIPMADAEHMLTTLCGGHFVEKKRHVIEYAGHIWEIDCFEGRHAGLVIGEVELKQPDEQVQVPPWAGTEITGDARYSNALLALSDTQP